MFLGPKIMTITMTATTISAKRTTTNPATKKPRQHKIHQQNNKKDNNNKITLVSCATIEINLVTSWS